jgi:hypothetical protein
MLRILPIQTKEEQKSICSLCNVKFNADLLAYAAYDDDTLMGVCQFRLSADGGEIYDLENACGVDNSDALFIMGRGTLNFIDLCGVHYARFCGEIKNELLLKAIGFKKTENGSFEINLEGFFTEHCGNHK